MFPKTLASFSWARNAPPQDVEQKDAAHTTEVPHDGKHPIESTEKDVNSPDLPTQEAQHGVQKAEAVTLVWNRTALIATYLMIFVVYFIDALQSQLAWNLTAYAISDFSSHSLIGTIGVVSNIMSGVIQLPLAKLIDLWSRKMGFAVMVAIGVLGLILMASCKNVETYAAAQVFYDVGFGGMGYVLGVIVADTSSLANRALMFAFVSSPYIATTFAGPSLAERFYVDVSWRWAYGTFAIVMPVICAPLFFMLHFNEQKAKKQGLLEETRSGRSTFQSTWFYIIEFDALGVIACSAGLVLFLLPFSLAGYQDDQWKSASIIAMLVIGIVLLIAFGLIERFVAPKPFIPFHLLTSPTVVGACILLATLFVAFYCWDGYYTSYLQVVHGLSISQAGYVANIYSIGSCFWALVVGVLIRWTGRFKWLGWCGVPVQCLGDGLMIHFRQPSTSIGYICMCQIFIAVAGGTLVICEQMAVMAVAEHGQVAALLAVPALSASVGGGIGSSISGAIWTNTIPARLAEYLPASAQPDLMNIYGDITTQLSYPRGEPVRDAIAQAYSDAQQRMCIAGTAVMVLAFIGVAMWKDVKVTDFRQVKGRVVYAPALHPTRHILVIRHRSIADLLR